MKVLYIKSVAYGVTKEQLERYNKFVSIKSKEKPMYYIEDIEEYLEGNGEHYIDWSDEYCTYEEMFAHNGVICGQSGVDVTEKIRSAFDNGIMEFDFYDY